MVQLGNVCIEARLFWFLFTPNSNDFIVELTDQMRIITFNNYGG